VATLALLQERVGVLTAGDVAQFFAGFALILFLFTGALLFTYWISKDE
jgi:hypothetical protein